MDLISRQIGCQQPLTPLCPQIDRRVRLPSSQLSMTPLPFANLMYMNTRFGSSTAPSSQFPRGRLASHLLTPSRSTERPTFVHIQEKRMGSFHCNATDKEAAQDSAEVEKTSNGSMQGVRRKGPQVMELPLHLIRRPLMRTRSNDSAKVKMLMDSIAEIGLLEPIDVLDVGGIYYGFSGCHRFEAHQRLNMETIKCRVRKGTEATLRMHMK